MADDEERLVVLLEARIRDLEKNMAKASGITARTYRGMSQGSKTVTAQMERDMVRSTTRINQALATVSTRVGVFGKAFGVAAFATLSAGALAAIAPLLSVGAALAKAKQTMQEFGDISDSAKASGLDAEFFQVLAHQSELGGVGVAQLSGALETFTKNSGLAAEGKGKMIKALQALNPELLKNILAATTQEERVRLAADAIDKAGTASEKAALSTTLFGDAGTRLVEVFSGGSDAIDATAKSARDMGLIIDREVIEKAEAMGDEFDTATKIMNIQFSKALVDLSPLLVDAATLAGDVASAIARIVDKMRDLENQSTTGLNTKMATMGAQRIDIENEILQLQQKQRDNSAETFGGFDNKLIDGEIKARQQQLNELASQEKQVLSLLETRNPAEPLITPAIDDGEGGGGNGSARASSRNTAAEAAIREAQAVTDLIAELEFERSLITMTDEQRRAAVVSREAGAAATNEQRVQIVALNEAIHDEEEVKRRAAETSEFFRDATYDAFASLIPQIQTGNAAMDSFINKMIEAVAQAALLGEGPLASLFGGGGGLLSLFGGGGFGGSGQLMGAMRGGGIGLFADGGVTKQPAIFGEAGPEAAVPLPDGRRIPVDLGVDGGSSSNSFSFSPTYNVTGNGEDIAALRRQMERDRADFETRVTHSVRKANQRGVKFGRFH